MSSCTPYHASIVQQICSKPQTLTYLLVFLKLRLLVPDPPCRLAHLIATATAPWITHSNRWKSHRLQECRQPCNKLLPHPPFPLLQRLPTLERGLPAVDSRSTPPPQVIPMDTQLPHNSSTNTLLFHHSPIVTLYSKGLLGISYGLKSSIARSNTLLEQRLLQDDSVSMQQFIMARPWSFMSFSLTITLKKLAPYCPQTRLQASTGNILDSTGDKVMEAESDTG